jgi:hypothetical protein
MMIAQFRHLRRRGGWKHTASTRMVLMASWSKSLKVMMGGVSAVIEETYREKELLGR